MSTDNGDMPGIKVPPAPHVLQRIEVTRTSDGRVHISVPQDRIIAYGLLDEARRIIDEHARNPGGGLVVPVGVAR